MSGQPLTLQHLASALHESAGYDDAAAGLDDGALDVAFTDLGVDSVALLETCARVEREYGIRLSDSTIEDAPTPRALLAAINEQLAHGRRTP
jgi:act minimal PKS acyl carrier protein